MIATPKAKLLIDVGWPGTLPKLQHALKRTGMPLSEITHLLRFELAAVTDNPMVRQGPGSSGQALLAPLHQAGASALRSA